MLRTNVHPGVHLRELIEEIGISQSALARHIQVKPAVVNKVCNGKRGISVALAQRLAVAFDSSIELWLNLQTSYELGKSQVKPKFGRLSTKQAA